MHCANVMKILFYAGGPIEDDIGADKAPGRLNSFKFTMDLCLLCIVLVHGQWGPWSSWSKCGGKCSRPVETRTRSCTPQKYEGRPCSGEPEDTRPCVLRSCARKLNNIM